MKAQKKTIRFTKIKEWYFPVNAEDYKLLLALQIPAVRIHENMMPLVQELCLKHNVTGRLINFNEEILEPYLEKLGRRWKKKDYRDASITKSTMRFETTNIKAREEGKKQIDEYEVSLRAFFERWGYGFTMDYSEPRGKCKFNITYRHNGDKLPVIPLVEPPEALPTLRFKIGFTRLTFVLGPKKVEINYSLKAGSLWKSLHTHECLYSQIGDVRSMMKFLMEVTSRCPDNENEPNE